MRPQNAAYDGKANGGSSPYGILGGILSAGSSLIKQATANNPSLINGLKQAGANMAKQVVVEASRNIVNAISHATGTTAPSPMAGQMSPMGMGMHPMARQMNQMDPISQLNLLTLTHQLSPADVEHAMDMDPQMGDGSHHLYYVSDVPKEKVDAEERRIKAAMANDLLGVYKEIQQQQMHPQFGYNSQQIHPAMGMLNSAMGMSQPAMGMPNSAMGMLNPAMGMLHPAMGMSQQAMGMPNSAMGMLNPAMGMLHSAMGMSHPTMGMPNPAMGMSHPAMGMSQPAMGMSHPAMGMGLQAMQMPNPHQASFTMAQQQHPAAQQMYQQQHAMFQQHPMQHFGAHPSGF